MDLIRRTAVLLALVAAYFLAAWVWPQAAVAAATDSETVSVTIHVLPSAQIEFPYGYDFVLDVPPKYRNQYPAIQPVLIPFKIRGNALASLSVKPAAFLRIFLGQYLGAAVRDGSGLNANQVGLASSPDVLGYTIVVKFPIPSWYGASLNGWDGLGSSFLSSIASLPGQDGQGTPPLTANVAGKPNGVLGVIFIVAKRNWTADGRLATPGQYSGSLEALVTADQP